jgi:hypothetical protein
MSSYAATALTALALLSIPAAAQADGTITATAGGTRSVTNTDSGYANPLPGVAFQRAAWVADPATATWSALCTTDVTGDCTSASLPDGRYLVRQAPAGAPAGWRALTEVAWGGGSAGASPSREYVGDVTVNGAAVTVHPSTDWAPTAPTQASGRFVAAKDNPPLPAKCGLDVLLLLDRSGSITPQRNTYRDAAQQLVNTLSGTPTRLKIYSFADSATADQNTFLDLSVPADVATANAVIDTVYAGTNGSTNWDAGMKLAAGAAVDTVVFVTDGNPTARDSNTPGANADGGGTVDLLDLTAGIASANKVKTEGKSGGPVLPAGATILGVGSGTGVTASNLAAVSGPTEGTDYFVSSIAGLGAQLQRVANQLCGTRIHVRKLTDDPDPAAARPGWEFTAGKPANSPVTFTPASLTTTGSPADDVINVDRIPAAGAPNITVAETQQAGYTFTASECRAGGFADVTSGGAATTTIATVHRGEDWYCTFRNHNDSIQPPPPPPPPPPPATPPAPVTPAPPADTPVVSAAAPVPAQGVAGSQSGSSTGSARLIAPDRCVPRAFNATVTGRGISSVLFALDGKRLRLVRSTGATVSFRARITPRGHSTKPHRVTARVTFKVAANTRARTLAFTYRGCARAAVAPAFTG